MKCTSGAVAWSATFDSQGNQAAATPRPGSYTGSYLTFDVSPDSSHIQDVSKQYVTLNCSSGATLTETIVINEIPITGLTTFSATESEGGYLSGKAVKVISTFTGHFHGLDTSGNQRVSGSYKQEIDYEDGSGVKCTSGAVAWSATFDSQGNQEAAKPRPGSYTGSYLTFNVSPDSSHIQDVSKQYVTLNGAPARP